MPELQGTDRANERVLVNRQRHRTSGKAWTWQKLAEMVWERSDMDWNSPPNLLSLIHPVE
jgi:hypothetical protein